MRVSPDGTQLAYVEGETSLLTYSIAERQNRRLITEELVRGLPPAWTPDGQLAYVQSAGESSGNVTGEIRLAGVDEPLGSIAYFQACEDANLLYDVDRLYARETSQTFLALSGGRFIYTPGCTGRGLRFWSASNQFTIGDTLHSAILSPNQRWLAAIDGEAIVVIDLTNFEQQIIETTRLPHQLGWDITGSQLFYSTRIPAEDSLVFDDESRRAELEPILGVFPYETHLNRLQLYQIDLVNGIEVLRWEGNGFAIGRIEGVTNGSGVLFTVIPSDRPFLSSVVNNEPPARIYQATPRTQLMYIALVENEIAQGQVLAYTGQAVLAPDLRALGILNP
jgi:hypothetical protein